jgi:hypothetical protein
VLLNRLVIFTAVAGLLAVGTSVARAQQPTSLAHQPAGPSWTFNVAPYLWMPSINTDLSFTLPPALGGTVSANSSIGFGDLVPHLNLGLMLTAEARYARFSVVTDFMYLNLGGTAAHFRSLNFPGSPAIPISASSQKSAGLDLSSEIWTLAGGYTLAQGGWGNLDVIAGFRLLAIDTTVDYSLGVTIAGPRGNGATFGGVGGVSGSGTVWNGIGGFRGSLRVGDGGFFIPYYFDIGAGGSNLTWQIASGLGYKLGWTDLALTYRYLSFEQGNSSLVRHMSINGPMITLNFGF